MARNLLTDRAIRNAKPKDKDYRILDGDGLFVLVSKTGGKSFQYRYKLDGVGQTATLKGSTTLAEARRDVEPLRRMVAAGDHPRAVQRRERAAKVEAKAQTFAVVAAAWVKAEARRKKWSADYIDEVKQSLRNHLPELDLLPVSAIVARVTAPLLQAVEVAAPMMEEKVSRRLHAIMDFAVELGATIRCFKDGYAGTEFRTPLTGLRRCRRRAASRDRIGVGVVLRIEASVEVQPIVTQAGRQLDAFDRCDLILAIQRLGKRLHTPIDADDIRVASARR